MLLTAEEARAIGEKVLGMVTADDAIVNVGHSREALTRLANNSIVHNVFTECRSISVSVAYGGRKGRAGCDSLEEADLKAMVTRAEEVARVVPPDPEYLPSLGPQDYLPVQAHFRATAEMDADERARLAMQLIGPARAAGYELAGTVETSESAHAILTKNGCFGYHPRTGAEVGCTVTAPDSTGWARDVTVDIARIDAGALARAAVRQARDSAAPQAVEPGKYTVVLMPAAAAELAEYLVWWAEARTTQEGLTYLSERLGAQLAGDSITIYSDPQDPRMPGCPFNHEGTPRARTTWVDRGRFGQLWWDRWTAQKAGVDQVPDPSTVTMAGGNKTAAELIATVERGILVTHFWYVRTVKADETIVTGMTRDGTFLIENGEIKHGVKNMRFNESCLGMLQRTVAVGEPGSCVDGELLPGLFPPIVVTDWNFVSASDF